MAIHAEIHLQHVLAIAAGEALACPQFIHGRRLSRQQPPSPQGSSWSFCWRPAIRPHLEQALGGRLASSAAKQKPLGLKRRGPCQAQAFHPCAARRCLKIVPGAFIGLQKSTHAEIHGGSAAFFSLRSPSVHSRSVVNSC